MFCHCFKATVLTSTKKPCEEYVVVHTYPSRQHNGYHELCISLLEGRMDI